MKLRNLAAFIFRLVGASFILTGISEMSADIFGSHGDGWLVNVFTDFFAGLFLGFVFIYYSRKLGALFCKGLDDDDSA